MPAHGDRKTIAFFGLGAMGLPMASRLVDQGHQVVLLARRAQQAVETLTRRGASSADTPAQAASGADFVITMLPDDEAVEAVLVGDSGVAEGAQPGTVVIDMSTISPRVAVKIGEHLSHRGLQFLDAPVSGGPARAETGELAIMAGGHSEVLDSARSVLDVLGAKIFHVGATGSGQILKACNNLVGAACMLADAEALALARAHGVDPTVAREVMLAGTAANWQLDKTIPLTVLQDDYSPRFALSLLNKDLRIAGGMAQTEGLASHMGDLVRGMYGEAEAKFGGNQDFSSVFRLYNDD